MSETMEEILKANVDAFRDACREYSNGTGIICLTQNGNLNVMGSVMQRSGEILIAAGRCPRCGAIDCICEEI